MKKETITISVKRAVWKRDQHPSNPYVAKCASCSVFVQIPEAVRRSEKLSLPIKGGIDVVGVGEFGHVLSEYNGGRAILDNLVMQCKRCNTQLGSQNFDSNTWDHNVGMLEADEHGNEEVCSMMIESWGEPCAAFVRDGKRRCRNKPMEGRLVCGTHLYAEVDL